MIPAIDAVGNAYREHLVDYTLIESGAHPPASAAGYPPASPEGRPPMLMTGRLRDTVVKTPAVGGDGFATCAVFPTVIYAATVQWGAVHTGKPLMVLWKRYVGYPTAKSKGWLKHEVHIGHHNYMDVAVAETIASGKLSRAAAESFMAAVWGG
jgi:hypothetical protein